MESINIVALLAGVLPSLGTIAFAIRNHAEFEISAQRSLSMRVRFMRWTKRMDNTKGSRNLDPIDEILEDVAGSTIRETSDWGEIFEVKVSETA